MSLSPIPKVACQWPRVDAARARWREGAGRVDATGLLQPAAVQRLPRSKSEVWCLGAQVGLRWRRSTAGTPRVTSGAFRPLFVAVCPLSVCRPPAQLLGAGPGEAGRRAGREPSILQLHGSPAGSSGAFVSPPGSLGCGDGRGVHRGAGWLMGPPQAFVGSLARPTLLVRPWAQADELGRDRCVRFELRALVRRSLRRRAMQGSRPAPLVCAANPHCVLVFIRSRASARDARAAGHATGAARDL